MIRWILDSVNLIEVLIVIFAFWLFVSLTVIFSTGQDPKLSSIIKEFNTSPKKSNNYILEETIE